MRVTFQATARLARRQDAAHRGARRRARRPHRRRRARDARAALLCKCDLLTAHGRRVSGAAGRHGRYYALADGEAARGGRGDPRALPAARRRRCAAGRRATGTALALADKLDTLAGIFAIGQKPSGTRDPFGLRRAAIGVLRIFIENGLDIDLAPDRLRSRRAHRSRGCARMAARRRQATSAPTWAEDLRLRHGTAARPVPGAARRHGSTTEMFDAVLATRPASPLDFDARLHALVGSSPCRKPRA